MSDGLPLRESAAMGVDLAHVDLKGIELAVIAAVGRNGAVGVDGKLPWHLPDDLQHFKRETRGHALILGRRTWQEIGRPLPGRPHIVVSASLAAAGGTGFAAVEVVADLATALVRAAEVERASVAAGRVDRGRICVIGGSRLWTEAWPRVDVAILTEIDLAPIADIFFPDVDFAAFSRTDVRDGVGSPEHRFVTWRRHRAPN